MLRQIVETKLRTQHHSVESAWGISCGYVAWKLPLSITGITPRKISLAISVIKLVCLKYCSIILSTDSANVKEVTFPKSMASTHMEIQGKDAVWRSLICPEEKRHANSGDGNLPQTRDLSMQVPASPLSFWTSASQSWKIKSNAPPNGCFSSYKPLREVLPPVACRWRWQLGKFSYLNRQTDLPWSNPLPSQAAWVSVACLEFSVHLHWFCVCMR